MDFDPIISNGDKEEAYDQYFVAELETMVVRGYSEEDPLIKIRARAMILIDAMTRTGIDALVPYLALSYFDRSVSREGIEPGMLRLYTLCCVLFASQTRDSEFSVDQFVKKWKHMMDRPVYMINKLEEKILIAIDWRLRAPTALTFTLYFIRMLPAHLRPWLATVTEVIIQTHNEILLTRYQPSMVAAAATFAVSAMEHPESTLNIFWTLNASRRLYMEDWRTCIQILMTSIKNKSLLDWITYCPNSSKMTAEEEKRKLTAEEEKRKLTAEEEKRKRKGKSVVTEPPEKMKVESEFCQETHEILDSTRVGSLVLKQLGLTHLPETEPDVPDGFEE